MLCKKKVITKNSQISYKSLIFLVNFEIYITGDTSPVTESREYGNPIHILELVVKLAHKYGLGEKKRPLPIYTFMRATVTTIVTICNNHISLKNDRSL